MSGSYFDLTDATYTELIRSLSNTDPANATDIFNPLLLTLARNIEAVRKSITAPNNPTITLTQGGNDRGSFTLNQPNNQTIDLDRGVPIPTVDPVLANNSWAVISNASKTFIAPQNLTAGEVYNTLGWQIGDEIDITVNAGNGISSAQTLTFQIYDFNHDKTETGTAGITFGMKNLMDYVDHVDGAIGMRPMNPTDINTPSGGASGWMSSDMLTFLYNVIFGMSHDVLGVQIPVYKQTSTGGMSPVIMNEQTQVFLFSVDELILPSETDYLSTSFRGEGYIYPIFTGTESRRKTNTTYPAAMGGNNPWWWTRSPSSVNTTDFNAITETGGLSGIAASTGHFVGVNFGFCV